MCSGARFHRTSWKHSRAHVASPTPCLTANPPRRSLKHAVDSTTAHCADHDDCGHHATRLILRIYYSLPSFQSVGPSASTPLQIVILEEQLRQNVRAPSSFPNKSSNIFPAWGDPPHCHVSYLSLRYRETLVAATLLQNLNYPRIFLHPSHPRLSGEFGPGHCRLSQRSNVCLLQNPAGSPGSERTQRQAG